MHGPELKENEILFTVEMKGGNACQKMQNSTSQSQAGRIYLGRLGHLNLCYQALLKMLHQKLHLTSEKSLLNSHS